MLPWQLRRGRSFSMIESFVLSAVCSAIFISMLCYVCVVDARRYIIPNEVSLILLAILPIASLCGAVSAPWWSSLGAIVSIAFYTGLPWYMDCRRSDRRWHFPWWIAAATALVAVAMATIFLGAVSTTCHGSMPDCETPALFTYVTPRQALGALIFAGLASFVTTVVWLSSTGRLVYGGGDAKFSTALAGWIGLSGLADFIVITALAGGLLAVTYAILRRAPALRAREWAPPVFQHTGIPYGLAIAFGAAVAFFDLGPL